jgi:hypothetical protein
MPTDSPVSSTTVQTLNGTTQEIQSLTAKPVTVPDMLTPHMTPYSITPPVVTTNQMKFTMPCKELAAALAPAIIVATKGTEKHYDDANKITLQLAKGKLTVMAHGGHVAIATTVRVAPPTRKGMITLPDARLLAATVAAFPPSSVLVCQTTADTCGVMLSIRDGEHGSHCTLPGVRHAIALPTPMLHASGEFQLALSAFMEAARVTTAVGWEKFKPEFMHWVFRIRPNSYRAAAGDGGRFLCYEMDRTILVGSGASYDLFLAGWQPLRFSASSRG